MLLLARILVPLGLEVTILRMLEVSDPMRRDSNMTWRKEVGELRVRCSKAGRNDGYNTK